MSKYLVVTCVACPPSEADIFLDEQPFIFDTHEHAGTYQDADIIRGDMAKFCNPEHIIILCRDEVEALVNGGAQ